MFIKTSKMSESDVSTKSSVLSGSSKKSRAPSQHGEVQPPRTHVLEEGADNTLNLTGEGVSSVSPRPAGIIATPHTAELAPGQGQVESGESRSRGWSATVASFIFAAFDGPLSAAVPTAQMFSSTTRNKSIERHAVNPSNGCSCFAAT